MPPDNAALYESVTAEAKRRFKRWPSAYGSMWVQKTYTSRGGTYSVGENDAQLLRWRNEKWIQVIPYLTSGKVVECGSGVSNSRDAKVCRPLHRVTPSTPITIGELVEKFGNIRLLELAKKKHADMEGTVHWSKNRFEESRPPWPDGAIAEVPKKGHKKYTAVFPDGKKVSFGDRRYQHFEDSVPKEFGGGKWSKSDHGDAKRRTSYRARHSGLVCKDGSKCVDRKFSPAWFSMHFLW